jgi:peptide/nickel transport system substrate-binding protein
MAFIMPERIARTDPFTQITEHVGSGPMRFVRNEWVPGARSVFERFADYQPRTEPANWLSGGKRMLVDRIEWVVMPDAATASAALQNGEVDWWENPITDLVPAAAPQPQPPGGHRRPARQHRRLPPEPPPPALQRRARPPRPADGDQPGGLHARHRRLRRRAVEALPGYFTPGTPLYTEEGGEILKGPRNLDAARALLRESGYTNQPITCWSRRTSRSPRPRAT